MRRLKFTLEYDGTPYLGWQRVHAGASVQGEIEKALLHMTSETLTLAAAGRTDKGVHALAQVAHMDVQSAMPLWKFLDGTNALIPNNIVISKVEEVTPNFHARFSATARRYRYLLYNRRQNTALWENRVGLVRAPLDIAAMQAALATLPLGEGDWSAFRSSTCTSSTPMCFIQNMSLRPWGEAHGAENMWVFEVEANHFLHHMVRTMVGTLVEVGLGQRSIES
ncbi:MAG: tRNA pseudouridine(38-40) synthase TruA, partial [Alphaproteobacteria bacterium]